MASEYMFLNINYDINTGKYELESNVGSCLQNEIIKGYLRTHQGTGMEGSQILDDSLYSVKVKKFIKSGQHTLKANFNNLGVRDYILHHVSADLEKIIENTGCLLG